MIILALAVMLVGFAMCGWEMHEEWRVYRRNTLQQWEDKKRVLLHSFGYAAIMGILAGAIHTIMFGGFQ